jgi:HlyD family secretion protein
VLLIAAACAALTGCADGPEDAALLPARRGDFEVLLRLNGPLRPLEERSIKSPHWGEIRRMVPNGAKVKRGQVILELDSERTEDTIRERLADVEVRSAELRQVQQEVGKSRRYAMLKYEACKLNRQLAASSLTELQARPTARELTDARSTLKLAQELVKAGAESVILVKELVDSGYAARDEQRRAELDLARARADLAAARANLASVMAGPSSTELQEAAIRVQQARLAERSAQQNIQITKEWADAKLARFRRRMDREKERLAEAKRSMSRFQVHAPANGVVLYAKRRWGGNWQPGQRVWQGATVMSLPDLSRMKVIVQVPASWVRRMDVGKVRARVLVRALPGRTFKAKLARISAVGKDEFERLDPSTAGKLGRAERQVFEAEVELEEKDARLKAGFGAEAELVLRHLKEVIIVPRLALVEDPAPPDQPPPETSRKGRPHHETSASGRIFVKTGSGFRARPVKILGTSKFEAAIEGDVNPGDLLYPGIPPSAEEDGAARTGSGDAPPKEPRE